MEEFWRGQQKGQVYKMVREAPPGRTAFLKRPDGSLTANAMEMQQLAESQWRQEVYCTPGRRKVDTPAVLAKYGHLLEPLRRPQNLVPLTVADLRATLGTWSG